MKAPVMQASVMKQRWTDYAILVAAILVLWQAAWYVAGPEAISAGTTMFIWVADA